MTEGTPRKPYEEYDDPVNIAEDLQTPPEGSDYVRGQANFLQNLASLIDTLRSSQTPDELQLTYDFYALANQVPPLPCSITLFCGDAPPHYITLSSRQEAEIPATTSLELGFEDRTLYISRDPTSLDPTKPDSSDNDAVLLHGATLPHSIDRIPRRDINYLVGSLLAGHPVSDKEWTERADLLAPGNHELLHDALQESAYQWRANYTYELGLGRRLEWRSENGRTVESCRFMYETGSPERFVVVDIEPTFGLGLHFSIRDAHGDTTPFSPDTGDLLRLQEIMQELNVQYRTQMISVESTDSSALDERLSEFPPEVDF